MDRTFDLRDHDAWETSVNTGTAFVPEERFTQLGPQLTCEVAFVSHYDAIRERCKGVGAPTLAVFAIDERGIAATALLPAREGQVETAIVGRHRNADVWLEDPKIALRHLAVLVHPRGDRVRFQVLDLRTRLAFRDERYLPLESIEADGPVFLHVGPYVLLCITLYGTHAWPGDPLVAWRGLPPRVYDGEPPRRRGHFVASWGFGDTDTATGVETAPGPRFARWRMDDGATPVGEVKVKSRDGEMALVVAGPDLRRGVLIGRYERCDDAGNRVLRRKGISRVHVLLIEVADRVYAIDTASTFRVWVDSTRVRRHALRDGDVLMLGNKLAFLTWTAVH